MKQLFIMIMLSLGAFFVSGCGNTLERLNSIGNSGGEPEYLIGNRVDYSYRGDAKSIMQETESYLQLLLGQDFDTAARVSLHREADVSAGEKSDGIITEQEAVNVRNKYLDIVGSATDEVTRKRLRNVDPNDVVDRVNKRESDSEVRWNQTE